MSFRDALAIHVAPIPLRLVLALTFVWAGLGKITQDMEVQGERAAILANMGVPLAPTVGPEPLPVQPLAPADAPAAPRPLMALAPQSAPPASPAFTAADFPQPVKVKRVYGLALLLNNAAFPPAAEDGTPRREIWPADLGKGTWPVALAWSVALTELVGGVLVLVGGFTRLSALALTGVMLGAVWLTQVGPAVQSGKAVLGFLPDQPTFSVEAWKDVLWQTALVGASFSLALLGSGALAIDRVLFGGRPEARPAAPAAAG